jgi:two-component system CheB/CheR fusion protein
LPTKGAVTRENVRFENQDGVGEQVTLRVEALPERAGVSPEFLIVFQESPAAPGGEGQTSASSLGKASGKDEPTGDTLRFQAELNDTREQLHSTIEAYEVALEELRVANEQLSSLNEQMQSSNEELETSKEELQSLNEEMMTVNQEVMHKAKDLDRANAELRDVFVNTRIATIFLDRKLAIRSFTPPAALVFSIRAADIGRSLSDLATSLDYPALHDDLEKVLETGAAVELSVRNKDANPRYFLIKLTPWLDSAKAVTGVVATFIDAPSLARAENTIEKLFSDRVSVIQAMSAGLAHEINQPLQAVSNYLTALRRQLTRAPDTIPEGIAHTLDRAINQVLRAGRIIRDLRAFIAEDEPDKTIFSLHELIGEVGEMFTEGPQAHKMRLTLKLAAGSDRVIADRTQIDQVLVNLLKNGQEAMIDSTARELTVETARIENGMIRVDVTDTGAGLSRELESRLFEPFLSTKTRGMGIGLPISRKIVEAHQGKIWARSNPAGGAIFSFTLPLADSNSGSSGEWAI